MSSTLPPFGPLDRSLCERGPRLWEFPQKTGFECSSVKGGVKGSRCSEEKGATNKDDGVVVVPGEGGSGAARKRPFSPEGALGGLWLERLAPFCGGSARGGGCRRSSPGCRRGG
jgi:hypothetical protein